jgi:phosphate-selective porin OprO/OprP
MDFKARLQFDFRGMDPEDQELPMFDFRRRRLGVEGTFLRDFDYEFEVEAASEDTTFRDAYVNYRRWRAVEFQGGKFKMPFGREELISSSNLPFVFRAHASRELAPSRSTGGMLHGRIAAGALRYQAGGFAWDGDNSWPGGVERIGGPTGALRMRFVPSDRWRLGRRFRDLEVGTAMTFGDVSPAPSQRQGLRGETYAERTYFPRTFVNGRRTRLAVEAMWNPGSLFFQGEIIRAAEQRRGQGVRQEDLPDVTSTGWYVDALWFLTGESRSSGKIPARPLFEGGWGALELGVRREGIRYGSRGDGQPRYASPRAANLARAGLSAWTFGASWRPNRYIRIHGNLIREDVQHFDRNAAAPGQVSWMRVARLQITL